MMLVIAPRAVRMKAAVRDFQPGSGPLTRHANRAGAVYSASGIWGDPTRATRAKGKILVEALVKGIRKDLRELGAAPYARRDLRHQLQRRRSGIRRKLSPSASRETVR